jgi:hypothetical protein
VLPSHNCEVCDIEQPLTSGSNTVFRDWATRLPQSWGSKMEIPDNGPQTKAYPRCREERRADGAENTGAEHGRYGSRETALTFPIGRDFYCQLHKLIYDGCSGAMTSDLHCHGCTERVPPTRTAGY